MIRVLLIFLLSFLITTPTLSQKDIERLSLSGIEHLMNFKWDKAEEDFRKITVRYPHHPAGYHFLSSGYLWHYLGNKDKAYLDKFLEYSDTAIDSGKVMLKNAGNDSDVHYFLGANYNYRAIAFAQAGNYLEAALASKKAEGYLKTTLELDPGFHDAYLGLGLFNFAITQIPSGFRWALSIAGIKGDADTGLVYIKRAAEKGKYSKSEAQYYLAQILSGMYSDHSKAHQYLKTLVRKHPANLVFSYALAVTEMKRRNLGDAQKILSNIIKSEESEFLQIIAFSHFLLGEINFRENEFEASKPYYHSFLEMAPDKDYRGIAAYRLGISYEITGQREEAEKFFRMTSEGNSDIEDDIFANRRGSIYSKRTMAFTEIEVLKAANLIESKKYAAASDTLSVLINEIKTDRLKSEAYLYLSEANFELGRFDESLKNALNALELNSGDEKWIKPYAYYFASKSSRELGDFKSAEYYKELAGKSSNFDYHKKLQSLLNALKLNDRT